MPKFVVFGNPIAHSVSPQLHRLFAQQFDMHIDYQTQLVELNAFTQAVDVFRSQGGRGANITIPFKTSAFAYADQLTERATIAGAVNTFIFRDTLCIGDNTDGVGFMRDLHNHDLTVHDKNILLIGAGGAARGILGEIIREKPAKICVHNRTKEKIKTLMDFFQSDFLSECVPDVIINTTNMNFQKDFVLSINCRNAICYDLNYGERHKTFYDYVKAHGAKKIINGLGMLIEQGAESFFQWTGKRPNTYGFSKLNIPVL